MRIYPLPSALCSMRSALFFYQILPGHFRRLFDADQIEDGRRDVGQKAFIPEPGLLPDENERHGVYGMRGIGLTGLCVRHHFEVAVVGGNEHDHSRFLSSANDPPEAFVTDLARLDRRLANAR